MGYPSSILSNKITRVLVTLKGQDQGKEDMTMEIRVGAEDAAPLIWKTKKEEATKTECKQPMSWEEHGTGRPSQPPEETHAADNLIFSS